LAALFALSTVQNAKQKQMPTQLVQEVDFDPAVDDAKLGAAVSKE
jgi:hypothetical protein